MPMFTYKAKDKAGNTITGTIDAVDERTAAAQIREMGHFPMDIRRVRSASSVHKANEAGSAFARYLIFPLWTGVNIRSLAAFFRQMAILLGSGMSMSEALRSAGSRTKGRLGRIIIEANEAVMRGELLSDSLARHPRIFNNMIISLLRAGEAGGLLVQMVDSIASYLEYELSIRREMSKVMFYPFVILFFIVVMPHVPTLILVGGHAFLVELWSSLKTQLPVFIAIIITLKLLFQFEFVRLLWDFVKIVPPVIGTAARKIAMSRFSRALALLYSAGLTVSEAVQVASEACANIYIARKIQYSIPALREGQGIVESLEKTGIVMPMVLDMLVMGEKTGNLDSMLQKTADYMDEEVDVTIHKLSIVLFVLSILIAGLIVGGAAIRSYSGAVNHSLELGQ